MAFNSLWNFWLIRTIYTMKDLLFTYIWCQDDLQIKDKDEPILRDKVGDYDF